MCQAPWDRHHDGSQSLLRQATDQPRHWAVKVARNSALVFAVEAIAVSQAQALAQEQKSWQGRVFLPTLQAVGDGHITDEIDQEEMQGASFLVMELAHGTLERHHGKLAGDALLMVAWALASTLALLNSAGFIHGDLKPSNVLWREDRSFSSESVVEGLSGWPLLTDLGSAQSFHSMRLEGPVKSDEEIQTHCWSPAYAAPEVRQCHGKMQTVKSDMYSYARTIEKISWGALPDVLQEICAKCLQEDPKQRPESFTVIAAVLEEACPMCVSWGEQLWHQQQGEFPSPALAHKHTKAMCKRGLEVLRARRMDRLALLNKGRKTKQAIEPCILVANQLWDMGSPAEACDRYREALFLNPCWAVHPLVLTNLGNAEGALGNAARKKELLERALKIKEGFYGHGHPEVAITLTNLGNAEGDAWQCSQAERAP